MKAGCLYLHVCLQESSAPRGTGGRAGAAVLCAAAVSQHGEQPALQHSTLCPCLQKAAPAQVGFQPGV